MEKQPCHDCPKCIAEALRLKTEQSKKELEAKNLANDTQNNKIVYIKNKEVFVCDADQITTVGYDTIIALCTPLN